MGKEISRIRLNRLYSESNIFEEISFHGRSQYYIRREIR